MPKPRWSKFQFMVACAGKRRKRKTSLPTQEREVLILCKRIKIDAKCIRSAMSRNTFIVYGVGGKENNKSKVYVCWLGKERALRGRTRSHLDHLKLRHMLPKNRRIIVQSWSRQHIHMSPCSIHHHYYI